MEHRHYFRRMLDLEAQICDKKGTPYLCHIVDIGYEGVGVLVEDANMRMGSMVEIVIPQATCLGVEKLRFSAYVIHRNNDKLGLWWVKGSSLGALMRRYSKPVLPKVKAG